MSETMLYHVGCGAALFTKEQLAKARGGMALACRCGANRPIAVEDLEDEHGASPSLPASLVRILADPPDQLPHLEYYLGFSDYTCPAKAAWERNLREIGLVAFAECPEQECQVELERQRKRRELFGVRT